MRELATWLAEEHFPERPWLILGKGPTFGRRHEFDLASYNLLSLNHVVTELEVDIAHIIDLDVVEACGASLLSNARFLLMPRVPNIHNRVSLRRLEDFVPAIPALRELDESGRLVWYDAETAPAHGRGPIIDVKYFSSEAALGVLGAMGVRHVRSLGVDGGQAYSTSFSAIEAKTRLANGQPSFDVQFDELDRIARRWAIDFQPLVPPIRVFVGADETQEIAARVLEHSIRAHTADPVRFAAISNEGLPEPRRRENRARTSFSFARFRIPELCGYSGRAIYLDSDMQVFTDIRELWEWNMGGRSLLCTTQVDAPQAWIANQWFHPGPQMSVLLMDCSKLRWDPDDIVRGLDRDRYSYADLLFGMSIVPPSEIGTDLPVAWNHLERYEPGETRLTHYTVVPTQPWRSDDNPLRDLWLEAFRSAVSAGAVTADLVEQHAARGWVKHDLVDMAKGAAPDPRIPTAQRSSAADVELGAALERIDQLLRRDPRWRLRSFLRRGMPVVRRLRGRGTAGAALGRSADVVRRRLG